MLDLSFAKLLFSESVPSAANLTVAPAARWLGSVPLNFVSQFQLVALGFPYNHGRQSGTSWVIRPPLREMSTVGQLNHPRDLQLFPAAVKSQG